MKVLSWNCRGLGSKHKEEVMKDMFRLSQPDIVLIHETKMEKEAFLQVSEKLWNKGGCLTVSLRGAFGEIGTLWDVQKFELIESKQSLHWILTKLLHKDSNTQVSLFNIYSPALYAGKKDCWNLLSNERSNGSLDNVILANDLNVALNHSEEKKRRISG